MQATGTAGGHDYLEAIFMGVTTRREGGALTVYLSGDIDHHSTVQMRAVIDAELRREIPKKLIFDMAQVGFSDSSGIGLVLGRYRLLAPLGTAVAMKNVQKPVFKVFKLGGIDRYVEITEGMDEI
ncbi:MAG: STAS domain-containing protein [Ruminococcaceae bacterium]|nr:STAS domain-containing protein [Oscillospiraceae bacterium]